MIASGRSHRRRGLRSPVRDATGFEPAGVRRAGFRAVAFGVREAEPRPDFADAAVRRVLAGAPCCVDLLEAMTMRIL